MTDIDYVRAQEELVKSIAKAIEEIYGKYWDIQIDLIEGNAETGYTLKVEIKKHGR